MVAPEVGIAIGVVGIAATWLIARHYYRRSPSRADVESLGDRVRGVDRKLDSTLTALAQIRRALPTEKPTPSTFTVADFDRIAESTGVRESVFQKLGKLARAREGLHLPVGTSSAGPCPACGSEDIGYSLEQPSLGAGEQFREKQCRKCGHRWV